MTFAAIDWLSISINLLLVVFVIICLLMTLLILMQRPKQEGLGAAFGGGVTDQVFGARTTNVLQRGTVYLGSLFFILALTLAVLIGHQNKQKSLIPEKTAAAAKVVETKPEPPAPAAQPKSLSEELPAETTAPADAPATTPADATPPPADAPAPAPQAPTPAPETAPATEAPAAPAAETPAAPAAPEQPAGQP